MKTIVHLISSLARGGAEKLVVDLANELSNDNQLKVIVISFHNNDGKSFKNLISKRVTYYELGKKNGVSLSVLYKLYKTLHKIKPDVIHTHTSSIDYASIFKFIFLRCKFIHTIHSDAYFESSGIGRLIRRVFFKLGLIKPIAISNYSALSAISAFKINIIETIENGTPKLKPSDPILKGLIQKYRKDLNYDYIFTTFGRIDGNKNQLSLLESVIKLRKTGINCTLILGGRIEDPLIFEKISFTALNNPGSFVYLGLVEDISPYLKLCDAFCISSYIEGLPISILEAMSHGKIVISTPAGGIPNIIEDNISGFIAGGFTPDDIFSTLERFINSNQKENIKANALNTYNKKFSIEICANKYKNLYLSK